ncbi:MAG TPA: IS110 family transposase [Acetobacteraceae bacterium]|nr:IS110 family transposase [Acetobacteraceae bacterium]
MRIETRPQDHPTATTAEIATLLVSFELSQSKWVLTVRVPGSAKLSRFTVPARDTEKMLSLLTTQREQVERRTGRPVRIVSIYEAGLDGFWLHRWLETGGVESHVVDTASILGPPRRRNAKTDRIDGEKLLRSLAAWLGGEVGVCSMVVPPSVAQEDIRRLSRERGELVGERTRLSNRISGLLANQGIAGFKPLKKAARQALERLRTGDGRELAPHLRTTIERILQRLELLCEQIKAAEAARDALLRAARVDAAPEAATAASPEMAVAPLLLRLRGIGPEFATVLQVECLNREFDNRRQLGAFAGIAPMPWASGSVEREQRISKAGNRRLRTILIELAWSWQRHQPDSTLTQWFHKRIKGQSARVKRIAIVALARKLLIALWRYVKHGVVPQGAVLKAV